MRARYTAAPCRVVMWYVFGQRRRLTFSRLDSARKLSGRRAFNRSSSNRFSSRSAAGLAPAEATHSHEVDFARVCNCILLARHTPVCCKSLVDILSPAPRPSLGCQHLRQHQFLSGSHSPRPEALTGLRYTTQASASPFPLSISATCCRSFLATACRRW